MTSLASSNMMSCFNLIAIMLRHQVISRILCPLSWTTMSVTLPCQTLIRKAAVGSLTPDRLTKPGTMDHPN
ncbi:hypothetical protein AR158_C268R [Paramecium bursaria Chlorella virus AR158]|uniref:hypothetical protein n=1 Tax=Paramecium bursaria Chlorella virus AR158 TaxID=380598 RepID=UPI00015AA8DC|nr:hypothetical protein AR158_C268R [Paramecium bursaria Chlorella virus AR158]ABU43813.1 hypothetical protein AR158_C268R [Paramecium bursaria Chlorella virus AR158]